MPKRKSGALDALLDGSARLGWLAGGVLAVLAHVGMRWLADQAPAQSGGLTDMSSHVLWSTASSLGSALQWILPLLILLGVFAGWLRRRSQDRLVREVRNKPTDRLAQLSWTEFEELLAGHFRAKGYTVVGNSSRGPDGGVDLEVRKVGELHLVQCKHWRARSVPVGTIRELFGVIAARGAAGGFVVSSGSFTRDAKEFAEGRNIELIDGRKLASLLGRNPELTPPEAALPTATAELPSCPHCGASMVKRVAKRGANAGAEFWGCSTYPKCRGTRPSSGEAT